MAHMLNHPFFCSDLVVSTRLSSTGGEEEELNDESVYSLLQRCHGDHGGAVPDGKNPSADGLWHGDLLLLGGLEHEFCDFPYIGNNHPNWLSYFSEGLKPPTRLWFVWVLTMNNWTMEIFQIIKLIITQDVIVDGVICWKKNQLAYLRLWTNP